MFGNASINIILQFIDPFESNDIFILWRRDKLPRVIFLDLFYLIFHNHSLIFIYYYFEIIRLFKRRLNQSISDYMITSPWLLLLHSSGEIFIQHLRLWMIWGKYFLGGHCYHKDVGLLKLQWINWFNVTRVFKLLCDTRST